MEETKDVNFLAEIWEGLGRHRGSKDEVARRAKCQREWVRLVLSGKYSDSNVVLIASEVLAEKEAEQAKIMEQVSENLRKVRQAKKLVAA